MPYITLAELKAFLDESGDEYDSQLLGAIAAAEAMVDEFTQRSFAQATLTERVIGTNSRGIFPKRFPITGVTSCTVNGQAIPASAIFFDDISVIRRDLGMFMREDQITLVYTAGYAQIPEDVKTAVKITAQAVWSSGDLDANMTGENIAGGASGSYQPGGPGSLPRAAQTILMSKQRVHS